MPPSTSALQLSTPASSVAPRLSSLPPLDSTPWLQKRAFPASPLHDLAAQIDALAVHDLALCKAFDQRNSADSAFASDLPSVQWLSTPQLRPPALLGTDATLAHALEHSAGGAPMSARVATAGACATPGYGRPSRRNWTVGRRSSASGATAHSVRSPWACPRPTDAPLRGVLSSAAQMRSGLGMGIWAGRVWMGRVSFYTGRQWHAISCARVASCSCTALMSDRAQSCQCCLIVSRGLRR